MNSMRKAGRQDWIRVSCLPAFLIGCGIFAGLAAHGELPPKLKAVPVCPAVAETARTNHIPLSDFAPPSPATNALRAGDAATVLGHLVLKKSEAQWLLRVEAAPGPTNPPAQKPAPYVVKMFGTNLEFESRPVPANLRMLGPFTAAGTKRFKPQDNRDQFSLNESFLSLGLDRAAAITWRRIQATNGTAGSSPAPAKPNFTPEEQRAIAGAAPALMSYLDIVQHTEGLEDILFKLVELPSLWSIIKHRGVQAGIYFGESAAPADPADWGLPASTPVYYFPGMLRLNGQPALKITLIVTAPRPPLLVCGGVVGLLAEKIGDDETYLTLRVISAQHHAGPEP